MVRIAVAQIVLVALLAWLASMKYCYGIVIYPFSIYRTWWVSPELARWGPIVIAIIAAVAATLLPRCRYGLIVCFALTFMLYAIGSLNNSWIDWLRELPLSQDVKYWILFGPGGGVLGSVPRVILTIVLGRMLFGLSLRDQWGGRLTMNMQDVRIGAVVGLGFVFFILLMAVLFSGAFAASGSRLGWNPNLSRDGVNLFSNLYEEIFFRGLLLQVVRRHLGNMTGIVWSSVMFGLGHGINPHAAASAVFGLFVAWGILRTGSLWTGWIAHQLSDLLDWVLLMN